MEFIPFTTLELDKPRTLRLTFRVLRRFRELHGQDILRVFTTGMTVDAICDLLYASFSQDDPDLTREQLEDMLHAGMIGEISESILDLIERSTPEETEEGNAESPTG